MRAGNLLQAAVVFTGVQLAFSLSNFAAVNVGFVIVWIVVAVAIFREHRKLTTDKLVPQTA